MPLDMRAALARRYAQLEKHPGEFQFRTLADEADLAFRRTGDHGIGILWANCLLHTGRMSRSEEVFRILAHSIPTDSEHEIALLVYVNYARVLGLSGHLEQAMEYLDLFLDKIPGLGKSSTGSALEIYANAQAYDRLAKLHNAFVSLQGEGKDSLFAPMLAYYAAKDDRAGLLAYFRRLASALGFKKLSLDNLDAVLDAVLRQKVLQPYKPRPSQFEIDYLLHTKRMLTLALAEQGTLTLSKAEAPQLA